MVYCEGCHSRVPEKHEVFVEALNKGTVNDVVSVTCPKCRTVLEVYRREHTSNDDPLLRKYRKRRKKRPRYYGEKK